MKYIVISIIVLFNVLPNKTNIIIRHDVKEEKYIELAEQTPATSALVYYNSTDLAGTLIREQWVLSAAHVAETIKKEHKLLIGTDSIGIEMIIIHPDWTLENRPDLALIKLNRKIENSKPLPLYESKDEINELVIMPGIGDFGNGKSGIKGGAGVLRAATNLVDGVSSDGKYLFWIFDDPESERVTELEGISGPGDSSGPALIKMEDTYFVAGISSAQSTRATGGVEGIYGVTEYFTRVSTYVEWINETIQSHSNEHAFDFWVGDWEVSWKAADSSIVKGSNRVVKILDGKVIQEHFEDPKQNFKGTSISVYNPRTDKWHQAWADNSGGYFDLVGNLENGQRIFEMSKRNEDGVLYRMLFSEIRKNSFIWEWQAEKEGMPWNTVWEINYKRKN